MPIMRMGEGLGFRHYELLTATLPHLDPARFGLADYDFYGGKVNFVTAQAHGLQRPILRVGQGFYGEDPQFESNAAGSKGLFSRDFYWMLDAQQSANGQAHTCADLLDAHGDVDTDSILFADFEIAPVNASFLYGFLSTLHADLPNLLLGIYTGYSYWGTYGSTSPTYNFQQYPLWISWPVTPYQEPAPLKPWTTYLYHQWTFNGDGVYYGQQSSGLDLDYRNPIYSPNPPPPTPGGTMATEVKVNTGQIANLKDMATGVLLHTAQAGESVYGTRSSANTDVIGFSHYYDKNNVQQPLAVTSTQGAKVSITGSNVTVIDNVTEPGTVTPPPPPPAGTTRAVVEFIDAAGVVHKPTGIDPTTGQVILS